MTEPLRYRRRRRAYTDSICRRCEGTIFKGGQAAEFSVGPYTDSVFHLDCSPAWDTTVPVCPDCLGQMHARRRYDYNRRKWDQSAPSCLHCQGGAA